jgi:hypothetical protein
MEREMIARKISPADIADPRRVLSETWLSKQEQRELLAFWLSDIHAVPDKPALRRLESGVLFHVDDLANALKSLDVPPSAPGANVIPFPRLAASDDGPDEPSPLGIGLRQLPPPVVIDARASALAEPLRRIRR